MVEWFSSEKTNSNIRAFIAISLPEGIKNYLKDLQKKLQKSGIKASWTRPEAMHLTLKFLGNISVSKIDPIKKCMEQTRTGILGHTLSASGIGVFPSAKNARVIWSEIRGQTDVLEKLANRLELILFEDMGIKKENKRFSPHLTIARIRQVVFPKTMVKLLYEFKDFKSEDFLVSEIKLFQSELKPSGAIYKTIVCCNF